MLLPKSSTSSASCKTFVKRADENDWFQTRILSRVDYCNVVLAGLRASSLALMQRVINAETRFVADLRPRDHVTVKIT